MEIELCEIGKKNPVIKRKISADSNSSVWFINGSACKHADVSFEEREKTAVNICVYIMICVIVS